jgi:hypothetical protein
LSRNRGRCRELVFSGFLLPVGFFILRQGLLGYRFRDDVNPGGLTPGGLKMDLHLCIKRVRDRDHCLDGEIASF